MKKLFTAGCSVSIRNNCKTSYPEELSKLLNYDAKKNDGKPLTYYRIQTCIKPHFIKSVPVSV